MFREALGEAAAAAQSLALTEVNEAFRDIAATTGPGSTSERVRRLRGLLARATDEERDFLLRLALGELRQGSLAGLMAEAIARASGVPLARVRRAIMVSGDLAAVGRMALEKGEEGLDAFDIRLFQPLEPMLAHTADDVAAALEALGTASLEYKMDGARVQAHKGGGEVRIYTRGLNEVTVAVPEVVEAIAALPVREAILDGEVLALRADGMPQPFQITMRRFGRKLNVEEMRGRLPVAAFLFDCLYLEGESLIDRSTAERIAALSGAVPVELRMPQASTGDRAEAEAFAAAALAAGHEGIMAKALDAPYEAGNRGKSWLKIKRAHTLDLVILAAEWGHGRRQGWLSNLHLGARDPEKGGFVMLGKTFKGLTDGMLEWQTRRLLELELARDAWTVYVRPDLVVEIAFSDVQASPRYPAGLALRLARVKRYRTDKPAAEADTIATVRQIFERQAGERGESA
jgi:DNA ligase-1